MEIAYTKMFEDRFKMRFSCRDGALYSFLGRIARYAGEFTTKDDSFKLRYKDIVLIVDNGVLVNVFRCKRG